MILSTHLIAGAAVGARIHNFWLVAILSIVVHFILDFIPHSEYKIPALRTAKYDKNFFSDLSKVAMDILAGSILCLYFGFNSPNFIYILVGMFFGILPDGLLFLSYQCNSKILNWIKSMHSGPIHFFKDNKKISLEGRIAIQLGTALIAILILS